MKNQRLYPLKFKPITKEKVWGGNKLTNLFGKKAKEHTGESWELSGLDENISVVINGQLKGKKLRELIQIHKSDLVGRKVYKNFGSKFPLLFKFIDANKDLSVQLHPDDSLAVKRHNSFGKTEMWYIMQAEKDARIILGFNKDMDKDSYLKALSENKIMDVLESRKVEKGDAFFIKPGTVHAIGAGVVLAEIQQTSDITYRIYDYDRPDIDGKLRELHTELALEAINFDKPQAHLEYAKTENDVVQLCSTSFFETNTLWLTKNFKRDISAIDSFVVYMCVEGEAIVETSSHSEGIKKGETLLIPAATSELIIKTSTATMLEVYIP